ncbi:hypothetical protein [Selenihalanaerobacter shriftii]|uniref:Uncharacterized protein n=1 Tax=Selenihalanaerobacter shriftii TaxID=142842 RepID=A0A1T4MDQ4_9FIRM|nr:hypothetical protein [Selenihalanaerobacter shriftii]SJZ65005.1 hypothetical protein SAMN02745118_01456 [Selenihalanaerobacter shriftii]
MAKQKKRKGSKWLDPNKEGKGHGRRSERYCQRCGQTVKDVRILKHSNLCEDCVRELEKKKEGKYACKGCGKVVPEQVQENDGYCKDCCCRVCGKPDPEFAKKHGFCESCFELMGTNCKECGKEAEAQVRRNDGYCDECADKM